MLKHVESVPAGWLATGEITKCPMCSSAFRALRYQIPIIASEFRCPACDKLEDLDYSISKITQKDTEKDGYEFEVRISCKTCTKKSTIRQFTKSLNDVPKVEVTSEGVGFK
jgi:predicted Zn finger-like uncharacterized protein